MELTNDFKQKLTDTIQVMQALLDGKQLQYRKLLYDDRYSRWHDLSSGGILEMEGIDFMATEYRIKTANDSDTPDKYADYPDETNEDETLHLSDLQEGRIYLIKSRNESDNLKRGYICVKEIYPSQGIVKVHFAVYIEQCGTMVHISDPDVKNYQSIASDKCCNYINCNMGIRYAENYLFYTPGKGLVEAAEKQIRRLGYEFKDGKMQKAWRELHSSFMNNFNEL